MDYRVIEKYTDLTLENEVKKFLKKGWKLQGGVSISISHKYGDVRRTTYAQALVKTYN
tara:strand:- start:76 stop:249 length:174 start_codon:yes stop_codon:yes gene_type:complete